MSTEWRDYLPRVEKLAAELGLNYNPVDFEAVPQSFMMEISVYGLPVRMPHWSFGVRYIYQLIQHRMGNSRLFEVVFPGNPGHAYLAQNNSLAENVLVTAHVLGHADFSNNNLLFKHSQKQVSEHIVEHAANHARQIARAIDEYGMQRVEVVLDAALALEQYIDLNQSLRRQRYPEYVPQKSAQRDDGFSKRFAALDPDKPDDGKGSIRKRAPIPPHLERDLLWFVANYAPELEGWASYWHARLLREADFLPQNAYVDAIKCHSDVVRPHAQDQQVALSVNPYHLGFSMWEKIIERDGIEAARRIMAADDDFSFVRNYLSPELAEELELFRFKAEANGKIEVIESDIAALHEALLAPKYNFGAPAVSAKHIRVDGSLELEHDHKLDGRGLDVERGKKVLEYLHRVWRRPVMLHTVDDSGAQMELRIDH